MTETIELTETARLRIKYDEDATCPRLDWDMLTGFVNIPELGDSRLMDVPAVHEDPTGRIAEAHDRLYAGRTRYGNKDAAVETVARWARIYYDLLIEFDWAHGGYWFVDPQQLRENWPDLDDRRIFRRYVNDPSTSETELHARTGQTVTVVGDPFQADDDEPSIVMQRIRFDDGYEDDAFIEELSSASLEKQAVVIQQEQETYEQWASGEVFGVILERRTDWQRVDNPDTTMVTWDETESLWGCYLDDTYTAQHVAHENFELTDAEDEALGLS